MMSRRFHKSDAFAVVGLLLLLVWIPAYWAQSDDAEALAGGERFHLPERRVGDVIEYSLVVRVDGQPAEQIGPVQRIEVAAARSGETPVPMAYVETRTTYAWSQTFGALQFDSLPFEDRHYYTADGQLNWRTLSALTEPSDDHPPRWVEAVVRTQEPYEGFSAQLTGEVQYEPNPAAATTLKLTRSLAAEFSGPPHSDSGMVADKAAYHQGRPLFGVLSEQELQTRVERAFDPGSSRDDIVYRGQVYLEPRVPHTVLRFGDDRPVRADQEWVWVSPEAPRLVGGHVTVREVDGPVYAIDLIATKLVRGTGPVIPFPPYPEKSIFEPRPPLEMPTRNGADKVPLSAVELDTGRIYQNASLHDVRVALEAAAPATVAEALAAGGRVVGFTMNPADTGRQPAATDTPTLPLAVPKEPGDVLVQRSNWTLALVTPEGTLSIARLWLEERPGPEFSARVEDACAGTEEEHHHGCDWTPTAPVDWNQKTIAPGALVTLVRQNHDGAGHLARFDPLDRCHSELSSPLGGWRCGLGLFGTLGDGSNMEWYSADPMAHGQAVWKSTATTTSYDLGDGHPSESWTMRDPEPDRIQPATASTAASEVPTVLDVVGTKTAWGGAILVLTTGALRFFAGIRAGMHVPLMLALFSRVSRADALFNERRADIIELLQADPGLTAQDVARRLAYSRTATMHHLETLMRTGQLLHVQNGQQRHFFPPDGTERERVRVALARDAQYANVLHLVDQTPGITLAELTAQLERSKSRLSRVAARLERLGVIRRERDGRALRLFPNTGHGS